MPSFVIKPERGADFYVYWSTIVEAPLAFGDRDWMLAHLREHSAHAVANTPGRRLDRADEKGSSALWPTVDQPAYGWTDHEFIYKQQGILTRDRMRAFCDRLETDENADVSDLLTPFEEDQ